MNTLRRKWQSLPRGIVVLITALVIYTPLSFIVIQSFLSAPFFSPSKEWSFESFDFIFTDPDFYKALKSGFILAFGLVFISIPLGGVLALFSSVVAPDTVFVALSALSGVAVVAVWISICASHFVFRRRHVQSGQPLSALQYRAPWYPLVPVLGFILCLVACVGLWFDPSQRIALYCGLPFVALCYGAYYLTRNLTTQEPEHVAE